MVTPKDLNAASIAPAAQAIWVHWPSGQVVSPPACRVPLALKPGDTMSADYGLLGHVQMTFSPDQPVPVQA